MNTPDQDRVTYYGSSDSTPCSVLETPVHSCKKEPTNMLEASPSASPARQKHKADLFIPPRAASRGPSSKNEYASQQSEIEVQNRYDSGLDHGVARRSGNTLPSRNTNANSMERALRVNSPHSQVSARGTPKIIPTQGRAGVVGLETSPSRMMVDISEYELPSYSSSPMEIGRMPRVINEQGGVKGVSISTHPRQTYAVTNHGERLATIDESIRQRNVPGSQSGVSFTQNYAQPNGTPSFMQSRENVSISSDHKTLLLGGKARPSKKENRVITSPKPIDREQLFRDILWSWLGCDQGEVIEWGKTGFRFKPSFAASPQDEFTLKELQEPGILFRKIKQLLEGENLRNEGERVAERNILRTPSLTHEKMRSSVFQELETYKDSIGEVLGTNLTIMLPQMVTMCRTSSSFLESVLCILRETGESEGCCVLQKLTSISESATNDSVSKLSVKLCHASCEPFLAFLRGWLVDGKIYDPCHEFFIKESESIGNDSSEWWEHKYSILRDKLPPLCVIGISIPFTEEIIEEVLYLGKSVNFFQLMGCLGTKSCSNFQCNGTLPETRELHVLLPILRNSISNRWKKTLLEDLPLKEFLTGLYKFALGGDASFVDEAINRTIEGNLMGREVPLHALQLHGLTDFVIKSSKPKILFEHLAGLLVRRYKQKDLPGRVRSLIRVKYVPPKVFNVIFVPHVLDQLERLSAIIYDLMLAKRSVLNVWKKVSRLNKTSHFRSSESACDRASVLMVHEMWCAIAALQDYMHHVCAHYWSQFRAKMERLILQSDIFTFPELLKLLDSFLSDNLQHIWKLLDLSGGSKIQKSQLDFLQSSKSIETSTLLKEHSPIQDVIHSVLHLDEGLGPDDNFSIPNIKRTHAEFKRSIHILLQKLQGQSITDCSHFLYQSINFSKFYTVLPSFDSTSCTIGVPKVE